MFGNVFRKCVFSGETDLFMSLINISMSGEVKSLAIGDLSRSPNL